MKWLKSFIQLQDQRIRQNEALLGLVLCGFLVLGMITQISSFASILQFRADHRSIVGSIDNDSAWGIETAERTNLVTDNERRSYGPVWYRVNYLMRVWSDNPILDKSRNDQQNKEKDIYFTLMLLSLLSVYGLAGAISFVFFDRNRYRLMSTLFLAPALIHEKVQATLLIIAKPDHFLALMVFVSFVSTLVLIQKSFEEKYLKWTAFFWGVTLSTKLTALPFIPILLVLIYSSQKPNGLEVSKKFVKYMVISYVLIGFPQNFDFWRNLAYINNQNKQTSWATWQSFYEWIKIYSEQFLRPAALLMLFLVIFPFRIQIKDYFQKGIVLKGIALFLIPFIFMLSRKIPEPFFRWYTFPFIAIGLILLGSGAVFLISKMEESAIGRWREKLINHPYSFLVLFFCLPWSLPLASTTLSSVQKEYEVCRAEAFKTESFIEQAVANKEYILADVYAPYSASYEGNWVDSSWEMRQELIIPQKTKWIVLKNNYYSNYLTKAEGGGESLDAHIKNIDEVRKFYRLFWKKDQAQDHLGQTWKKIYSDACGFEVWKRD